MHTVMIQFQETTCYDEIITFVKIQHFWLHFKVFGSFCVMLNPSKPAPTAIWALDFIINHNSWTDWTREPLKASLDAETSKESNEPDQNIPLPLRFLTKIHICIFAVLTFRKLSKKLVLRIRLVFPIRFLRFADDRNPQKQDLFKQTSNYLTSKTRFSCLCCCAFVDYFVKKLI